MGPRLGDRVIYTLTKADAEATNRRRQDFASFHHRASRAVQGDGGRTGHQAHFGNHAGERQECAAIVVRVHEGTTVNLQVFLDGNDELWATSVHEGIGPGTYRYDDVLDDWPDGGE